MQELASSPRKARWALPTSESYVGLLVSIYTWKVTIRKLPQT